MSLSQRKPEMFLIPVEPSRRTFTEALREKYLLADDEMGPSEDSLVIKIDIRGKPKDTSKGTSELGYLRNAVLSEKAITHAGLPDGGLKFLCPNIVDLDLSTNMISDWNEIISIICSLPHLKYVNLSRNIIAKNQNVLSKEDHPFPRVENLVLNQMNISWREISALCRQLSSLKELHICGNGLRDVPDECLENLLNLDCLRMNDNHFKRWEEIWKLGCLPKLKSLVLSGNPIQNIFYFSETHNVCTECKTRVGDQVGNMSNASACNGEVLSKIEEGDTICAAGAIPCTDISSTPETDHSGRIDTNQVTKNASECSNPFVVKTAAAVCQNIINEVLERVCQRRHSINTDTVSTLENSDVEMYVSAVTNMMDNRLLVGCDSTGQDSNKDIAAAGDYKKAEESEFVEGAYGYDDGLMEKDDITPKEKDVHKCPVVPAFSSLESLCLSNNHITDLEDIESLSKYPTLHSLRIKGTKIAQDLSDEDRRKLFIACLPNITVLNGSEVNSNERHKSERYFIRHFKKSSSQPKLFETLMQKHGDLDDLVHVDLSRGFCEWAEISIVYENVPIQTLAVHVIQPVGKLKKKIAEELLFIPRRSLRMYHFACGPCHPEGEETAFEELPLDSIPLSRYNVMHGDEIHIERLQHDDIPVIMRLK